MTPALELRTLLRPAGGGVHLVSTGKAEQLALQNKIYAAHGEQEVSRAHGEALSAIGGSELVVLGVPSDVGAGFLRGANMGPQGLRLELLRRDPAWFQTARARGIVDIGDVFVVPQLLRDEMLSAAQIKASQDAIYSDVSEAARKLLPVSPLSIEMRAVERVLDLNPDARFLLLGGDHSTAWPLADVLARRIPDLGIVQVDAHTDMLETRLGVEICFATWSYHASRALKSPERLLQFGTRASRFPKEHWETKFGIRQVWADACTSTDAIDRALDALEATGVRRVYFSNDIDGTDETFTDATGTPEPGGLTPDFVLALIERLGRRFQIVAADVMEVAPPVARTPDGAARTLRVGGDYLEASIRAMNLGSSGG